MDTGYDVDGGYTVAGGVAAMAALLSRPVLPTAVFAQSDEMAMGALRAIRKAGLRCPEDVSVVGFDDHELAELFELTTVAQPVRDLGAMAARHLVAALRGVVVPDSTTVPTHLVIRGTTCPPGSPGEAEAQVTPPAVSRRRTPARGRIPQREDIEVARQ